MKATISPKLLALVFASSLLLGICVQAAAPREDSDEATFTTIDFPGASSTIAVGVNPRGEIVGAYDDADGVRHGFLLSGDQFTSFDFPGASFTVKAGAAGSVISYHCTLHSRMEGSIIVDDSPLVLGLTGLAFSPSTVRIGSSFSAAFTGSNLTDLTYFDVRYPLQEALRTRKHRIGKEV